MAECEAAEAGKGGCAGVGAGRTRDRREVAQEGVWIRRGVELTKGSCWEAAGRMRETAGLHSAEREGSGRKESDVVVRMLRERERERVELSFLFLSAKLFD